MANIIYRQIPALWELPQQIPAPRAKAWMQKPQGGGKCLVQIPGDASGGWLWMKLIPTLSLTVTGHFNTTDELSVWTN